MNNISQQGVQFKPSQLHIFTYFLIIYSTCAAIFTWDILVIALLAFTWIFSYLIYLLLRPLSKNYKQFKNTIISALIFFLVYHYTNTFIGLVPYSIGLLAIQIYKNFGYIKGLSFINPALLGLFAAEICTLVMQYFFQFDLNSLPFISWWGAQFGTYASLVLILIWLAYGPIKWNKQWILIPFLALFLLAISLLSEPTSIIPSLLSSTTYFFATIMLIEPKTSPAVRKPQIIYGLIAGLIYFGLRHLGIEYYELIALATANLYFFISRRISAAKNKKPASSVPVQ